MLINKHERRLIEPPALPRLSSINYEIAMVGGGFSAASLLIHLLKDLSAIHTGASNAPEISYCNLPRLPSFHVTVFEPRVSLGTGIAYGPTTEEEKNFRLTNGAAHKATTTFFDEGLQPWLDSHHPGLNASKMVPRAVMGEYHQYCLQSELKGAESVGVDFTLKHEHDCIRSAQRSAVPSTKDPLVTLPSYTLLNTEGKVLGPFDAIIGATGHTAAHRLPALSHPLIVKDGFNFEEVKQVVQLQPKLIVLAGFGSTCEEVLLMLKHLNYRGGVIVVSPELTEPLNRLGKNC